MEAGRLRDRITIRNFTTVRDSTGQPLPEWADGLTVWAEISGISGKELLAAHAEHAESTVRIWVRYRTDITAASRLRVLTGPFKGLDLEVSGPPVPDSRRTRLEILCKQGVKA